MSRNYDDLAKYQFNGPFMDAKNDQKDFELIHIILKFPPKKWILDLALIPGNSRGNFRGAENPRIRGENHVSRTPSPHRFQVLLTLPQNVNLVDAICI